MTLLYHMSFHLIYFTMKTPGNLYLNTLNIHLCTEFPSFVESFPQIKFLQLKPSQIETYLEKDKLSYSYSCSMCVHFTKTYILQSQCLLRICCQQTGRTDHIDILHMGRQK